MSRKFDVPVYTTRDIYLKALRLLNRSGYQKPVRNLAVSVYGCREPFVQNFRSVPPDPISMPTFSAPLHVCFVLKRSCKH